VLDKYIPKLIKVNNTIFESDIYDVSNIEVVNRKIHDEELKKQGYDFPEDI
jgi:hypothetical protein